MEFLGKLFKYFIVYPVVFLVACKLAEFVYDKALPLISHMPVISSFIPTYSGQIQIILLIVILLIIICFVKSLKSFSSNHAAKQYSSYMNEERYTYLNDGYIDNKTHEYHNYEVEAEIRQEKADIEHENFCKRLNDMLYEDEQKDYD